MSFPILQKAGLVPATTGARPKEQALCHSRRDEECSNWAETIENADVAV
jgi:hypothetical protein